MNPRDQKRFRRFISVVVLLLTASVLVCAAGGAALALVLGVPAGWLLGWYGFDYCHHYGRWE